MIDAIDNVDTKADLIQCCVVNSIDLLVSTGSGARLDAAPMRLVALPKTKTDPLVRSIRQALRQRKVNAQHVQCVVSAEIPPKGLTPLEKQLQTDDNNDNNDNNNNGNDTKSKTQPGELAVLPNFRVRIMPVYAPLPCAFGTALAASTIQLALQQQQNHNPFFANNNKAMPLQHHLTKQQITNFTSKLNEMEV